MKIHKLSAYGLGAFVLTFGATLAFGQARTPYTRPAYITTPGTVTAGSVVSNGNTNTQTLNVGTTTTGPRVHALTTSTVYGPTAFGNGQAVFGTNDISGSGGAVYLSYKTDENIGIVGSLTPGVSWRPLSMNASDVRFRWLGTTDVVTMNSLGIQSIGVYNSSTASGNQAFTCTNVGCRLSLGNTARYLFDNGTNLASNSILSASQFVSRYHTASSSPVEVGTTVAATEPNPIQFSTSATFTSETANFVSAFNGPNQIFAFSKDGLLRVNKHNAAKPTCNADNRGRIYYLDGAAGVADTYEVCTKNSADVYGWSNGNTVTASASSGSAFVANSNTRVCLDGTSCTTHLSYNSASTRAELSYANGTSLFVVGSGGTRVTAGSFVVDTSIDLPGTARLRNAAITIADSGGAGAAAYTQSTYTTGVRYTCNDADGCDVTMSEVGAVDGFTMNFFNLSANTVNFTDTAGVTELAGNFAMGQYDSLTLKYVDDRWVETSRSNN